MGFFSPPLKKGDLHYPAFKIGLVLYDTIYGPGHYSTITPGETGAAAGLIRTDALPLGHRQ